MKYAIPVVWWVGSGWGCFRIANASHNLVVCPRMSLFAEPLAEFWRLDIRDKSARMAAQSVYVISSVYMR
jgi:hypothetical protein